MEETGKAQAEKKQLVEKQKAPYPSNPNKQSLCLEKKRCLETI